MFETYRMLGGQREAELEAEAARLRPLAGRPINRLAIVIIAVCLAAVAFGATIARAGVALPGSTSAQPSTPASYPDLIERWVATHKTYVLAPDDRIRVRPKASSQVSSPTTSPKSGDGFDWAAAGVGASTIAGLLLVGLFGAYALRGRARSAAV